jgi:hypothetical protein
MSAERSDPLDIWGGRKQRRVYSHVLEAMAGRAAAASKACEKRGAPV